MPASRASERTGTERGAAADAGDREWIDALRAGGPGHHDAVRRLRQVVEKAARHQVSRMPQVWAELGPAGAAEIVESAADEATVAVLARLDRFEGRSRFTTWVYKFGILHAAAEARRVLWRDRPVSLDDQTEPACQDPLTPASHAEAQDFAAAVADALATVLTPHQQRVARALVVDEVPIDVLAERLGSNRNALYKTLHDARVRLRAELFRRGFSLRPAEDGVA